MRLRVKAVEGGYHGAVCRSVDCQAQTRSGSGLVEVEKRVPCRRGRRTGSWQAQPTVLYLDRTGQAPRGRETAKGVVLGLGPDLGVVVRYPWLVLGWALAGGVGTRVEPREQRVRACVRDAT